LCYYKICVGVKEEQTLHLGRCQWPELRQQHILIVLSDVQFWSVLKLFVIFLIFTQQILSHFNLMHSSRCTKSVSSLILIFDHLFYMLKHILSIILELVSLYASHMKWLPDFQRKILPPWLCLLLPWRRRECVTPKRWYICTKLHEITTKATIESKKDYSFVSCNESCKPEQ